MEDLVLLMVGTTTVCSFHAWLRRDDQMYHTEILKKEIASSWWAPVERAEDPRAHRCRGPWLPP